MMARRTSGSEGCGGGPSGSSFSPRPTAFSRRCCKQAKAIQAGPGPALEVAEAEFILELLMHRLAGPARLNRGGQPPRFGRLLT
jgi:hypothetical protein